MKANMSNKSQQINLIELIKQPLYDSQESIFITGATGFLGGNYLYWKLHTSGKVFVLSRGESEQEALSRIKNNLKSCAQSYDLPDIPEDELERKLVCVRGDLKSQGLGLSEKQIIQLQQENITEIWHFAASLSYRWEDQNKIDATNLIGTQNLLDVSKKLKVKRFIYISTAYTAGKTSGSIKEQLHSEGTEFTNYYEQSKCYAEKLVSQYTASMGIASTIVRPSIVLGPVLTQRSGGTRFGLYGFFNEMYQIKSTLSQLNHKIRLVGDPKAVGNFIPVDQVVADLLYLRSINFGTQPIYHSVNPSNLRIFDVIKQCEQHIGTDCIDIVDSRDSETTTLESMFDGRTEFYEGYYGTLKSFERSLPHHKPMSLNVMNNYIRMFQEELVLEGSDDSFERHQVKTWDGNLLTVYSMGSPNKETIIIANAYGMPVDFMQPLASRLSRDYHVITWDTRWVPGITQGFELEKCHSLTHAKDAISVLDSFCVKQASTIGWSSGVQVVLRALSAFPARFSSAVLLNGGISLKKKKLPVSEFEQSLKSLLPKISSSRRNAELYCQLIYGNIQGDADDKKAINSVISSTDPRLMAMTSLPYQNSETLYRYANMMNNLFNERDDAYTSDVHQPVLVVGCQSDEITHPESAVELSRCLSNGRLLMLEDSGHFAHYYDSSLAKSIIQFIVQFKKDQEGVPA